MAKVTNGVLEKVGFDNAVERGGVREVLILAFGVIAALNQIGIATAVTTPILIAVLATVGGVVIVGVGGGLVRPMQDVWQDWIGTIQNGSTSIRHQIDLRKADGQTPSRPVHSTAMGMGKPSASHPI